MPKYVWQTEPVYTYQADEGKPLSMAQGNTGYVTQKPDIEPEIKPLTTAKKNNNYNTGNSGGITDPYAGYRADLDDLYNKVMGYGGYTAGTYTPGRYSAKYDTSGLEARLNGFLDEIDNYEEFKYDLNADMLYKNAVDNALTQGQLAMQDTTAHAAALTGGYGNSYAAAVGNQAYQNYVTQVNNNIPAYQQMAMDVWQSGLDQRMNQYNAGTQQLNNILALEAQNFAQWQANENAAFSAWQANENNRLNEWQLGYNQLLDQYNLGVSHIGNLETYAPKSSGSSSSGSSGEKAATGTGKTAGVKPLLDAANELGVSPFVAQQYINAVNAAYAQQQQQQYTLDDLIYALSGKK